jgi:hypothetical protein
LSTVASPTPRPWPHNARGRARRNGRASFARRRKPCPRLATPAPGLTPVKVGRAVGRHTGGVPNKPFLVLLLAMAAALGGCASGGLLPDSSVAVRAEFGDFDTARNAFETIEPYKTTISDLKTLGFDTASPNVRSIGYPDVVGRLAPNSSLGLEQLDPGIRDCILARLECRVYEYRLANETRVRKGSFALDWLDFKRTVEVKSWQFDGIVAVSKGVVLFRNYGAAPHNERTEREFNPLGPLQGVGDSVAGRLLK